MSNERICLVTTPAIDYLHFPDKTTADSNGGTTPFYRRALSGSSLVDVNLIWISPPKKTEVHIYPLENYGFGINDSTVDSKSFNDVFTDDSQLDILISTTLRSDFDLTLLKPHLEKIRFLFIDVQGFTRNGREHEYFNFPEWLLKHEGLIFKIGEEEYPYVNIESIIENPKTIVLSTKGKQGFTLMHDGNEINIPPSEVVDTESGGDRGAGDTLLVNFAVNYLQNTDIEQAARGAEQSVIRFLRGGK